MNRVNSREGNMVENQITDSQQSQNTATPASQPAQSSSSESSYSPENYVHKDKMNEVVRREKAEAYERARRELQEQQSQPHSQSSTQHSANTNANVGMGGMQQWTPDDIKRYASEAVKQTLNAQSQLEYGNRMATEFEQKLNAVSDKYPDFKDVVNKYGADVFTKMPHAVLAANALPNCGDVIYDMLKNPSKLATIMKLQEVSTQAMKDELYNLSKSIEANQAALNTKPVNEPLDHITPSPTIGADNGVLSVRDFKKRYR